MLLLNLSRPCKRPPVLGLRCLADAGDARNSETFKNLGGGPLNALCHTLLALD